ncbi:Hypothetical Protein NG00_00652 [Corynebacterium camporealensis]|nr:Hypothetical Protein NG00_00652 [Corynebacterium camporealensis]
MKLSTLTWDLQKSGIQNRSGNGTVSILAIIAIAVGSAVSFLVAAGAGCFSSAGPTRSYSRPAGQVMAVYDNGTTNPIWLLLAVLACAVMIPAVISLVSQATVLGAAGRERRLATLRLIGLSAGDVTRMTMLETAVQAIIGIVLGLGMYFLTLPLYLGLEFQATPIESDDLIGPWGLYSVVAVVLFLLCEFSAFLGMQRVRVTPLGVSRQQMPKSMHWSRLVAFVVVVVVAAVVGSQFDAGLVVLSMVVILGITLFLQVLALNLVMPWALQLSGRLASALPGTAHYVAARRVATNGRKAWSRCGSVAFFGFIAGLLVISPFGEDDFAHSLNADEQASVIFGDIARGGVLVLIFGFIIAALSIFVGQAKEVYDSAGLNQALSRLGVQRGFHFRVNFFEVFGPVVLVSVVGFLVGAIFCFATFMGAGDMSVGARVMNSFLLLGAGWAVVLLALLAVVPLRNRVIDRVSRKND